MSINTGSPAFAFNQTDKAGMLVGFEKEPSTMLVRTMDDNGQPTQPKSMITTFYHSTGAQLAKGNADYNQINNYWSYDVTPPTVGSYLVRWKSSDNEVGVQMFIAIDVTLQMLMYQVQGLLDKSIKDNTQTYGYTDADLFMYLLYALNEFNTVPPISGISMGGINQFMHSCIVNLAVLYGAQAQMFHSIDSDVSYNDQGISLNIDHFSKLNAALSTMAQQTRDLVKKTKWAMGTAQTTRVLAAYNPERARGYLFSQLVTSGFPYFSLFGVDASAMFRA